MATIAALVKEYYNITGSGPTNKLTTKAKNECGYVAIATKQLNPVQFEAVKNWFKTDAIAKGKYKEADTAQQASEVTPCSLEPATLPAQNDSTSIPEQIKPKNPLKGITAVRYTIRLEDGKAGRRDIFIEPEFNEALLKLLPDTTKRVDWLKNMLITTTDKNPVSAIRCEIVSALLNSRGLLA